MPDESFSQYPNIAFAPFDRGVDGVGQKTLMPDGMVHDSENIWYEPGKIRRRGGVTHRDSSETDLTEFVFGNVLFGIATGAPIEVVLDNEFAWTFAVSVPSYTSIFTYDDTVNPAEDCPAFKPETLPTLCQFLAPITTSPNENWLMFTDGEESPDANLHSLYKFDGSTTYNGSDAVIADAQADARALGRVDLAGIDGTDLVSVKQAIYYADHLMVANYKVNGGEIHRKSISWGDVDTDEIPTPTSGDFGTKVLTDAKGEILRLIKLNSHLAIYFDESIVICDPTPGAQIYLFDTRVLGTGLIGSNAVVDIGGVHIFAGQDNIYIYDGGLQPQPIGDRVIKRILDELDFSKRQQVLAHHIVNQSIVMFFFPSSTGTWGKFYAAFNYKYKTWAYGRMGYEVSSVGYGIQDSVITCQTAPYITEPANGSFGDLPCSDFRLKVGYKNPVLGMTSTLTNADVYLASATYTTTAPDVVHFTDGREYVCIVNTSAGEGPDHATAGVDGTSPKWAYSNSGNYLVDFKEEGDVDLDIPIVAWLEPASRAIGKVYGNIGRVLEVLIESKGPSFSLLYSTDLGESWSVLKSGIGGTTLFETERVVVDFRSQFITFRIQLDNNNSNTQIRVLTVKAQTTSERTLDD